MIKERTQKHFGEENKTVSAGIFTSIAVSGFICACFFIFKNSLSLIFADSRAGTLFLIILPGVILTSVYAVIRGFFWGTKRFYVYSVIELLEEVVMIAVGVFTVLKVTTVMQKAVWASVAVLISYVFSFTVSGIVFVIKGGRIKNPVSQLKPLISSSAPITFMRASSSLTSSLIALILPAVLIKSGMNSQQAISQFGIISGMTLPLLFIPSTLIGSISLVLTPELAESYYKKNTAKLQAEVEKSTLSAILIATLIIPTFMGTGNFIGKFIYNNTLSGIYLRWAAPAMLPMSICMITGSLLNSIGMEKKTLIYHLLGSSILLICVIFLPAKIGNYALILGYLLSYTLTAILNVSLLKKICCKNLEFVKKLFICIPIIIFSAIFSHLVFSLLSKLLHEFFAMVISTFLTLIAQILTLLVFNVFNFFDLGLFKQKNKKVSL